MQGSSLPAQVGTLGEHTLASLLAYALATRHDGTLRLTELRGGEHAIAFRRGGIVGLTTAEALPSIGRLLVALGALDEELRARASRAFGSDDDAFGEELVATGAIPASSLTQARAEQIARGVARLFTSLYESTAFSLVHEPKAAARVPPIDPLPLVLEGLLAKGLDGATESRLRALGDAPLTLSQDADPERLRADHHVTQAMLLLARTPTPISRLGTLAPLPEDRWRCVVAALAMAGWITDAGT